MPLPAATRDALISLDVHFFEDEPLGRRVYWRVGGPADGFVLVRDLDALQQVIRATRDTECPSFLLGKGSNLLVSDAGIRGLVVSLGGALAEVRNLGGQPPRIQVGAGLALTALLARARKEGWTGLECFAGIPGTVGAAVVMNAGSHLGETVEPLVDIDVVNPDGSLHTLPKADLQMSYRTAHLPPGAVIARARFQTTGADPVQSQASVREFLLRRKATQPLNLPSCGSTFRNPPGDYAGRLIDAAGLKGFTIGGARVSERHANFIVNTGAATAREIRRVIEHVQARVEAFSGVRLRREVHYAGDWTEWPATTGSS
ncbi:MAG: UDP-N-acetylmuramate dehydrogenase [Deltaproteobacteria bacterium]|nr:UDP-N-acetylmuramate dehydrogenase [Deltaproteobacteria bacterium]